MKDIELTSQEIEMIRAEKQFAYNRAVEQRSEKSLILVKRETARRERDIKEFAKIAAATKDLFDSLCTIAGLDYYQVEESKPTREYSVKMACIPGDPEYSEESSNMLEVWRDEIEYELIEIKKVISEKTYCITGFINSTGGVAFNIRSSKYDTMRSQPLKSAQTIHHKIYMDVSYIQRKVTAGKRSEEALIWLTAWVKKEHKNAAVSEDCWARFHIVSDRNMDSTIKYVKATFANKFSITYRATIVNSEYQAVRYACSTQDMDAIVLISAFAK